MWHVRVHYGAGIECVLFRDPFVSNWTYTGSALSVEVTSCVPPVTAECDAAPAVANAYLDSIHFKGGRGDINSAVAQRMTEGARFDGIDPCKVDAYRAAVVAFVKAEFNL